MRGYGDLVARHALPAQYLPRSRMRLRSDPIFSGRIGAGLRVLLFVVAVALTLVAFDPPLTGAIARWTGVAAAGPRGELLAGVVALRWVDVLLVLAVTRAFAALERRDMGAYGLPWRTGALMEVVTGMIVGTAAVAAVLGALGLADALTLGPVALGAASTFVSGAAWAVALLAVAALEEMLFRGYLLATLGRSIGSPRTDTTQARRRRVSRRCFCSLSSLAPSCGGVARSGCRSAFTLGGTGLSPFSLVCPTAARWRRAACSPRAFRALAG
jgi:membrane protease YdiL (CAAX protease family)